MIHMEKHTGLAEADLGCTCQPSAEYKRLEAPSLLDFFFEWRRECDKEEPCFHALYDIWERWYLGSHYLDYAEYGPTDKPLWLYEEYHSSNLIRQINNGYREIPRLHPPNERQKAEMCAIFAASRKVEQGLLDSYCDSMYEVQL